MMVIGDDERYPNGWSFIVIIYILLQSECVKFIEIANDN